MLGNFFNNMYYGKAGKGDYRPEDLPANRWQLFFEMLRVRWGSIVKVNLLYILIWIPAIVWTGVNISALFNIANAMLGAEGSEALAEAIGDLSFGDQVYSLMFSYLLGMIPCIAITGPFTAGVSLIMRNWARDQHVFIMSDFKDAVRENWKQALAVSSLTSVIPWMLLVCWRFYGAMAADSLFFIVPQVFIVMLGVIWMLALTLIYSLMITYRLKFGQLIRNSVILAVGTLFKSVGIRLITLVLPLIALALTAFTSYGIYVMLVVAVFYLFFGFGFNRFIYASYANALCDQYVNPRIEGAPMNLGLRQETDDDYEIDPTLPQPPQAVQQRQDKKQHEETL
ncbi:MAG TPA: DUF624 domain-containing protein [Clostridia bacterium]|nr:DUF624 domain-containing protein [Clostridia bacterium]